MEIRRSGKLNFQELAKSIGVSARTIYRVLNNESCVREETRNRVTAALKHYGFCSYTLPHQVKVLFDFAEHPYLTYYGEMLMENLTRLNCPCISSNHQKDPRHFFDCAGECDVVVFASVPDQETINLARKANPEIYTINLSTRSIADVTISPNNVYGSELAAEHFFNHGHRHIAVHLCERHPNRLERWSAFRAHLKMLSPDCRVDTIVEGKYERTRNVLRDYLENTDRMPTGIMFLAGEFAENYYQEYLPEAPEHIRDLSVVTFDHPADWEFKKLHYDFDRIEFNSRDLVDWAEYYILNRPMMKRRSPVRLCIDVRLVTTGSVKKIMVEENENRSC